MSSEYEKIILWAYGDNVTFIVVDTKAFVISKISFREWYGRYNVPHSDHLEFTRFIVEAIEKVDADLKCLREISELPNAKAGRNGNKVRIFSDGKPEDYE